MAGERMTCAASALGGLEQPPPSSAKMPPRWRSEGGHALRGVSSALFSIGVVFVAVPAHAEQWRITPTIGVSETLSDNVFLSRTDRKSDLVTSITPGVSIVGTGRRANLNVNYSFTENLYVRESSSRNHQNALSATGMVEAVENWLFVDASASISQQYLSPFGAVSPSTTNINNNQTETSRYSISPYVKGRLFSSAEYLVRYSAATTSAQSSQVSDLKTDEWSAKLKGVTSLTPLTWSLDASNLISDYASGRTYHATRYDLGLAYRINPQWQLSLNGGRESNDYASLNRESNSTSGYGFVWTPGAQTKVSGSTNKRFFGSGFDVSVTHRMSRSLWTYRNSRDVSFQPPGVGTSGPGSNYDAFYTIIAAANPGLAPDAIRAQVNQILLGRGIPNDGTVVNGFLTNRPNVQRLQEASVALLGIRNTVTLTATESEQQQVTVVTDSATPDRTKQRGVGLVWGHQLTGLSSLAVSVKEQRSRGLSDNSSETTTHMGSLSFSTKIAPKTSAILGARRSVSSGTTGYTESALTGALSHSF